MRLSKLRQNFSCRGTDQAIDDLSEERHTFRHVRGFRSEYPCPHLTRLCAHCDPRHLPPVKISAHLSDYLESEQASASHASWLGRHMDTSYAVPVDLGTLSAI